jgi:hypothetical protein
VGAPFEGRGEVVRRRESLIWAAFLFVAVALVMMFFRAPLWASFIEIGLAFALVVASLRDEYRIRRRGTLRVDLEGLRIDGDLVASRRSVGTAYMLAAEQPTVRVVRALRTLSLSSPALDVVLESEDQAHALLAALDFGLGESVATFRATRGSRWIAALAAGFFPPIVILICGPFLRHLGLLSALMVSEAVLAAFMFLTFGRLFTQVEVGSDGILLRSLGKRRFISYRSIQGASIQGRLISLALRTGERIRLDLLGAFSEQERSRDALTQRIEQARDAFVASKDTAGTEALVAPGGRDVNQWVRDVRALARARDYREARVDSERLWNVVTDASAAPATRAGAAVALASAPEGDARARLRVASEACADPRLRAALVRVADGASASSLADALASLVDVEQPAGEPTCR